MYGILLFESGRACALAPTHSHVRTRMRIYMRVLFIINLRLHRSIRALQPTVQPLYQAQPQEELAYE